MKCERCGTDEDVDYVIDPYQQEINDREIWVYLCPDCYHECCMDI